MNTSETVSITPRAATLRKLPPRAKMPAVAVLEKLTPEDRVVLRQILSETLECVFDPAFRRATAEQALLTALPDEWQAPPGVGGNDDSGMDLLAPPRHKVLTADEERQLFLRYNYCRYRLMLIVRRHRGERLGMRASRAALHWAREALQTRNAIVRLNTSLVMAMARRTRTSGVELSDLISEGNLALLRCVDKFDCLRGFKFSTYACRAIMSGFSRLSAKAARHRSQFPAPFDATLERSDYLEKKRDEDVNECVRGLKLILAHNSADLSSVEQRVLSVRFALDAPESTEGRSRAPTLEQVGALLGVSKERVRQIQNRAMKKLRTVIEESVLAAS
jgi:RNA polymerase primary sigma factor